MKVRRSKLEQSCCSCIEIFCSQIISARNSSNCWVIVSSRCYALTLRPDTKRWSLIAEHSDSQSAIAFLRFCPSERRWSNVRTGSTVGTLSSPALGATGKSSELDFCNDSSSLVGGVQPRTCFTEGGVLVEGLGTDGRLGWTVAFPAGRGTMPVKSALRSLEPRNIFPWGGEDQFCLFNSIAELFSPKILC